MYSTVIQSDEYSTGGICYVARHPALSGCKSHGDTVIEAQQNLDSAREDYLFALREDGLPIPAPDGNWVTLLIAYDCTRKREIPFDSAERGA